MCVRDPIVGRSIAPPIPPFVDSPAPERVTVAARARLFPRPARLIGSTRVSRLDAHSTPRTVSSSSRRACVAVGRGGRRSRASGAGRLGVAALVVLLVLFVTGLLAATIAPYPAGDEFLEYINKPQPPFSTPHHVLGTDVIGHDFLTQLLFGLRESVFSSLVCALGATLIGAVVGALAGYYGGCRRRVRHLADRMRSSRCPPSRSCSSSSSSAGP